MTEKPTFNFLDPDFRKDPHAVLARVRAENPVHRDANGIWIVMRHADVSATLKDPRLGRDLRSWIGYPLVRPYLADSPLERCVEQWMFSVDGAQHARLRSVVARAFTPHAIQAMKPHIETAADELLDLADQDDPGEIEMITAFAQPFPVRVIARVLGLPMTIYDELKRWSATVALVMEPVTRRRDRVAANDAAIALMEHLRTLVADRRERRDGDVVGLLLAAAEDGEQITEEELVAQLVMLFIAGHETTTNLIGNGLLALCRHPDQMALLRADPTLGATAIEEMLRYEPSANTVARVAHEPVTVGGQEIEAGQLLMCMAGSANRDPLVFAAPDHFDVARTPNPHVTFGGGMHYCLGAPLARLEAEIAFGRLLARFSTIDAVEENVRWRDLVNLRGLAALPVRVAR